VTRDCGEGKRCPYLAGRSLLQLLAERDWYRQRVETMEPAVKAAAEEIRRLREHLRAAQEEKEALVHRLEHIRLGSFKENVKQPQELPAAKRGAPAGHVGRGRKRPASVDRYVDIWPQRCQRCGREQITRYRNSFREHYVQDIEIKTVTTCYRIHDGYCPVCRSVVHTTDIPQDILPRSRIGPNARSIAACLRSVGLTYRTTGTIFRDIFRLPLTHPSLAQFDTRLADHGLPLYEQIRETVRSSSSIHADETGWRLDGHNAWLWTFLNKQVALFRIETSRGSAIVEDTLGKTYPGTLVSDFYSAYNPVAAVRKQKCLVHLLRDIRDIRQTVCLSDEELRFCDEVKTTFHTAMEAWRQYTRTEISGEALADTREKTAAELIRLCARPIRNKELQGIVHRIIKHHQELLTFLDHPEVEPTNNRAERGLRPSVIMRKITFGNRSQQGARNHAIIMSIVQTGILNGRRPLDIFRSLTCNTKPP